MERACLNMMRRIGTEPDGTLYTTPSSAALFLMTRPRAAARLIARQLRRKPVNLANESQKKISAKTMTSYT